jgi:seryl-tRNA synthetase
MIERREKKKEERGEPSAARVFALENKIEALEIDARALKEDYEIMCKRLNNLVDRMVTLEEGFG